MMRERELLVATTNAKKGGEMQDILTAAGLNIDIIMLSAYPDAPPVDETGETFAANALLKAHAAVGHTGLTCIADDGGLVIDALGGRPGVKSHRFLGEDTPFAEKMARILEMMRDVPEVERTCRFQCAVAIVTPQGHVVECMGVCEGRIAHEMKGEYGFGYDPIFFVTELGKHMAELPPAEKHKISHRGKALACAVNALRTLYPPVK